jgi:hypothetical protein
VDETREVKEIFIRKSEGRREVVRCRELFRRLTAKRWRKEENNREEWEAVVRRARMLLISIQAYCTYNETRSCSN